MQKTKVSPRINIKLMKTGLLLTAVCLFLSFAFPFSEEPPAADRSRAFSQLDLQIAHELEELRIDIRRETDSSTDPDGNSTTEDRDYHPLGFDLGNGLFYDLNGNLALRLKHLFALDEEDSYSVKRIRRVEQDRGVEINTINTREICREWRGFLGIDRTRCLDVYDEAGRIQVTRNGRFCYQIVEEEDVVKYSRNRKGRRGRSLAREGERIFVEQNRRKDEYKQEGDEVRLARDLMVRKNAKGDKIEIYRIRRYRAPRLIHALERKGNELLIKNRRRLVNRIELQPDKITVYGRRRAQYAYERLD